MKQNIEQAVTLLLDGQRVELVKPRADVGRVRAKILSSLFERTQDQMKITKAMTQLTLYAIEDLEHLEEER